MTEPNVPTLLEVAAERTPVGPPPVDDMIAHVHRHRRRRTAAVLVGAVAAVTAVTLGATALTSPSSRVGPLEPSGGGSSTLTVITELDGPRTYYFEGALTEVSLSPAGSGEGSTYQEAPAPAGQTYTWEDVPNGSYTLDAAVRPCGGACDALDPPTDSCWQPLDVREDTTVVVTFHYGRGCQVGSSESAEVGALAGGTWRPLEKYLPDAGDLKVKPGKGEVRFHDNGTWTGFDGCNHPGGSYRIESGVVNMTVSTFDVGCANFSPYDQLNGHNVAVDPTGHHLTVTDDSGQVLVEYTR